MKLTAYQKRHLEALAYLRSEKSSVWRVLAFRPLSWLPILLIAVLSVGIYFVVDMRWGMFAIGLTVGAILRIISHTRFAVMAWPVTEAVTDWSKVEELRRTESA